jgi:hypothetical protein
MVIGYAGTIFVNTRIAAILVWTTEKIKFTAVT